MMGRIAKKINIKVTPNSSGEERLAVFDTGAERSYVKRDRLPDGIACDWTERFTSGIGGESHEISEVCHLNAEIHDLPFDITAYPVENIGTVGGEEIDLLVGALAMEQWEIVLNPKKKDVDISRLENREFSEY